MIIVNGLEHHQIAVTDRGLCYGDGLFETIKVKAGQPKLWHLHIERLCNGCDRLQIPLPEMVALRRDVETVIQHSGPDLVIKLMVTRGSGQRGYAYNGGETPTVIVMSAPEYRVDATEYLQGVRAITCQTRLSQNAKLAGMKHLNRLEQVMARAEWRDPFIREGIMFDTAGWVIEGTMSNILLEKQGVLYTPQLSNAGVCGVMRRKVIDTLKSTQRPVCIKEITEAELLTADSVAICNALLGVMPLSRIDDNHFAIGPLIQDLVARQLQDADA